MPVCVAGSPDPASVANPSRKSVACDGIGNGFQRRRSGVAGASLNGPARTRLSEMRTYGPCAAEGRRRYSQVLRFSARGAVNAVPERTSGYNPLGGRRGELRTGSAPAIASELNELPKPFRYLPSFGMPPPSFL